MRALHLVLAATAAVVSAQAMAAPVAPTSYDAPPAWGYVDSSYTGYYDGNTGQYVGGLGELTDGFIPVANFNTDPYGPSDTREPFVGWDGFNPQLTFHFQPGTTLGSAVLYFDDAGGAGAVNMPLSATFTINGVQYAGDVVRNGTGGSPISFSFGSGVVATSASVEIQTAGRWTFMSEATFDSVAAPVPEPGEWAMIVAGLGVVGAAARRRKRA